MSSEMHEKHEVPASLLAAIKRDILRAHGSLEDPDFHFRWEVLKRRPYRELLDEAITHFFMKDRTDLNQDGSFVYIIQGSEGDQWMLQLSMVGPYAVLLRIQGGQSSLLDEKNGNATTEETVILKILKKHGVSLLDVATLTEPISLRLDYTDPENVRIYQALFSDTDRLPWGGIQDSQQNK